MSFFEARSGLSLIALAFSILTTVEIRADDPIDVGSRRELFVDDALIERLDGARQVLHPPVPREIVLVHDAPWEGSGSGYHSVFQDGDTYRMYYKAWQLSVDESGLKQPHKLFTCYAESRDGIVWTKPNLGLHEFAGSKANNITIACRSGLASRPVQCSGPLRPVSPSIVARATMPCLNSSGNVASDASSTPSARSPCQVNATVTQRRSLSTVARASAAECTFSSIPDSHLRAPSASLKDRNS